MHDAILDLPRSRCQPIRQMSTDTMPAPPPEPPTLDEILSTLKRVQDQRDAALEELAELRSACRQLCGVLNDQRKAAADVAAHQIELEKCLVGT